jgi:hypothetical protein
MGFPWYEEMWAFQGDVFSETAPAFLFHVKEVPSELTLEVSQTDIRYEHKGLKHRREQAPLLLRFYQCSEDVSEVQGGEIQLVHCSPWGSCRDAMCGVKVLKPGKYLAMVTMPVRSECFRMIFRSYSTMPVAIKAVVQHRQWIPVQGSAPLHAIPYALAGFMRVSNIFTNLPRLFNEAEGRGHVMANPLGGKLPKKGDRQYGTMRNNQWGHWQEELHSEILRLSPRFNRMTTDGLHIVGKTGGTGAHATAEATEMQGECCVM